jgi:hypothetical protein
MIIFLHVVLAISNFSLLPITGAYVFGFGGGFLHSALGMKRNLAV